MNTASYRINEENVLPAAAFRGKSLINAGSKADDSFTPQPLARPLLHGGHSEISDDELITSAQQGDQQAFVELCERYSSRTKRTILRIVRNQEDAEDALQDTLLRAYTHLASFRRSCRFSTWLMTIGVNSALIVLRKRKVRRETYVSGSGSDTGRVKVKELVDPALGPEEVYLKQQAILVVKREVERLPPRLRSVVNHYYESDGSMEDSAKALDISLSAAKSRLVRGRRKLRSSLAGYVIPGPPN